MIWELAMGFQLIYWDSCVGSVFIEGHFTPFLHFLKEYTHVAHLLRGCALGTLFYFYDVFS
jgi:hypothetical protein